MENHFSLFSFVIDRSIAPRRTDPCNEKKAGLSFIAVRLAPCARKLDNGSSASIERLSPISGGDCVRVLLRFESTSSCARRLGLEQLEMVEFRGGKSVFYCSWSSAMCQEKKKGYNSLFYLFLPYVRDGSPRTDRQPPNH